MKSKAISHIESLVQNRRTSLARKEIRAYLRVNPQAEALFLACEWFRRLGLYKEGLALTAPKGKLNDSLSSKRLSGKKALWTARFLNYLGASSFAMILLDKIEFSQCREYQHAGEIYLANFKYERALGCFNKMRSLELDTSTRIARIGALGLADTLSALGRHSEAQCLAKEQLLLSEEPLLKGICLQVIGEYLARQGRFKLALQELESASSYFQKRDETVDRALLLKWIGYCRAKLGEPIQGKKDINKAIFLFQKLDLREEAWLDTARLKLELGWLDEKQTRRMLLYPGLPEQFKSVLPSIGLTLIGHKRAPLQVDLSANEFQKDQNIYFGLPLELTLAGWLRLVENWGISQIRASTLLWSDQLYSYDTLEQRIFQLIKRLRNHYNLRVFVKKQRIYLDKMDYKAIAVTSSSKPRPPSFLRQLTQNNFVSSEVSEYYGISVPQAIKYIRLWELPFSLKSMGRGRNTHYRYLKL